MFQNICRESRQRMFQIITINRVFEESASKWTVTVVIQWLDICRLARPALWQKTIQRLLNAAWPGTRLAWWQSTDVCTTKLRSTCRLLRRSVRHHWSSATTLRTPSSAMYMWIASTLGRRAFCVDSTDHRLELASRWAQSRTDEIFRLKSFVFMQY